MPKMQKELSCFNYVYFGLFFLGLVSVHFFHLFIIQSSFSNFPFMVTALLQCLIEVTLLMCIAEGIRRTLPAFFNGLFILGTACLFLAHLLDFPLVRVMDMSVWYALDFISQESVNNFLEILSASNVSTLSWMIGFFVGLAIIVIALGCYVLTQRCSKAYPLSFSFTFCSLLFLFSSIALFVWDNSGNCYSQSSLVAM